MFGKSRIPGQLLVSNGPKSLVTGKRARHARRADSRAEMLKFLELRPGMRKYPLSLSRIAGRPECPFPATVAGPMVTLALQFLQILVL